MANPPPGTEFLEHQSLVLERREVGQNRVHRDGVRLQLEDRGSQMEVDSD